MHPVVALGVRHEGLPQLVHLLVFQLLNQEVVRIKNLKRVPELEGKITWGILWQ